MLFDQGAQTKPFVQLPRQQRPGVGAHRGPRGIRRSVADCTRGEPEPTLRASEEPPKAAFMRALRDYVLVGSRLKTNGGTRRRRTRITPLLIIVKLKATAAIPRTSSGMSVAPCSSNSAVSATTGRDGLQP